MDKIFRSGLRKLEPISPLQDCEELNKVIGNLLIWSRVDDYDMQVLKLSESSDFTESLITATSALKENSKVPSSQEGHPTLNNF